MQLSPHVVPVAPFDPEAPGRALKDETNETRTILREARKKKLSTFASRIAIGGGTVTSLLNFAAQSSLLALRVCCAQNAGPAALYRLNGGRSWRRPIERVWSLPLSALQNVSVSTEPSRTMSA